ncbi:hypothetical protein FHR32_005481 [Streptosporangium album]|uniref:Uncharacterized protein n=2 Tax=Streptosporangium album TaxID=47479 RepID=A0A7W7RZH4_9ACTN|nr:hypothetical protein [Streptosporangium album]MBB4941104.1 hypothetical protein [Streptosporangium album]
MRRRVVLFGHIVGPLTALGYINLSGLLMIDPVERRLGQHNSPEKTARILEEMLNLPGVTFGFQMPWIFFALFGLPILLIGVWRSGFAHWWVPLAGGVVLGRDGERLQQADGDDPASDDAHRFSAGCGSAASMARCEKTG